ncbi:hypothetical protein Tco_1076802, partial [Tanacetum coccineum]
MADGKANSHDYHDEPMKKPTVGCSYLTEADPKVLMTQDIRARSAVHIFDRIGFAVAKRVAIGYVFLPLSFSSLGELEEGAVTLLKRIRKFSMAQDIGAHTVVHIFNRIDFAIAKGVRAQL